MWSGMTGDQTRETHGLLRSLDFILCVMANQYKPLSKKATESNLTLGWWCCSEWLDRAGRTERSSEACFKRDDLSLTMAVAVTTERVHTNEIQQRAQRLSKGGRMCLALRIPENKLTVNSVSYWESNTLWEREKFGTLCIRGNLTNTACRRE